MTCSFDAMKRNICTLFAVLLLCFAFSVSAQSTTTSATTTTTRATPSTTDLLSQIQELLRLVTSLQEQLNTLKAEQTQPETQNGASSSSSRSTQATAPVEDVSESLVSVATSTPVFTHVLLRNSSGHEVHELQVFLASLSGIYPEGLITNFYGPLTEKAVQRFQAEYGIADGGTPQTTGYGVVGVKTRAKIYELMTEGAGRSNNIPQGLLSAPGIQKKLATTPQEGTTTIPAIPAQARGQTGTTTIPAIPAQPAINATSTATSTLPIPIVPPGTPPPTFVPTPTPIVSPGAPAPVATTTTTVTPSQTLPLPNPATSSSHSCGTPVYVPRDFSSIQTGLNSACSGDTVFVSAGTYYENIKIPRSHLTLKGVPGTTSGQVIIDGGSKGDVVSAKNVSDFAIDGFTLTNGRSSYPDEGAGLAIIPDTDGVMNYNAGVTIVRNLIVKNNITGIAVWNTHNGNVMLERNLIVENMSNGIDGESSGNSMLTLSNNTIVYNGKDGYYDNTTSGGLRLFKNNIIVNNGRYGIGSRHIVVKTILYNNTWNNFLGNYHEWETASNIFFSPSPGTGELSVDPKFVSLSDYHLQSGSPMINAGDPSTFDPDGSRADMGAYPFVGVAVVTDTTPPVISNVTAITSSTNATITWSTDEASDSQVEYGVTASYGTEIPLNTSLVTSHTMNISGLSAGTQYHYRVKSKDAAGNLTKGTVNTFDYTFTTPASATVTLVAPTYIRADWVYSWGDIRDNTMGRGVIFQYPTDAGKKTTKFRLYARNPGESSFSIAAEFTGIDSTSCAQTDKSIVGQWILDNNGSCGYWNAHYVKDGSTTAYVMGVMSMPLSTYSVGEYSYYFTAVDANGVEGSPSPTARLAYINPLTIVSPTANQTFGTLTPTFQWTVNSDTPSTLPHFVIVFDKSNTTNPIWSPYFSGGTSKMYSGSTLDPAKQYIFSVFGIDVDTGQNKSTLIMPNSVRDFTVASATTTASVSLNNLASIIASLMELLQKIQSTL